MRRRVTRCGLRQALEGKVRPCVLRVAVEGPAYATSAQARLMSFSLVSRARDLRRPLVLFTKERFLVFKGEFLPESGVYHKIRRLG